MMVKSVFIVFLFSIVVITPKLILTIKISRVLQKTWCKLIIKSPHSIVSKFVV